MAKKKSVVWIWRDKQNHYCLGSRKPWWGWKTWNGNYLKWFCSQEFQRLFPFFKLPIKGLGKITNTANALTFEIVETKKG